MGLKYSRFKIFHYKDKLDSLSKETKQIQAPLQIRIKPTNVCAHNCWYCAYKADNLQLGKDMVTKDYIPKEKMFEIIDDVSNMGVKSITFSGGGDPFHYKYFVETIQRLSKTTVKFATLTHGALLNGDIAKLFAKYGSWVRISIDGWDDKSYSEYRGVKEGEFSKVIANIKNFKALGGKCSLGMVLVIDKKNISHLYEMSKMFYTLGVNSIKISPCIVSNDAKVTNDYHNEIYDYAKEQIDKVKKDFGSEVFEIFDAYHRIEEKFTINYEWCPYIQICPVIGADQNLYTCHDKAYNLDNGVLGSLKDISLKEFWFSDKNNFFKVNPKKDCKHHCAINDANKMILEYVDIDKEHMDFV